LTTTVYAYMGSCSHNRLLRGYTHYLQNLMMVLLIASWYAFPNPHLDGGGMVCAFFILIV